MHLVNNMIVRTMNRYQSACLGMHFACAKTFIRVSLSLNAVSLTVQGCGSDDSRGVP